MALTNDQMKALRPGYDKTNITLGTPMNVTANAPIDSRLVVANEAALTTADAFTSIYQGMIVTAADTGQAYVYIGNTGKPVEAQVVSNWKKIGDASGDISNLQSQITTNKSDITALKETYALHTEAIDTLNGDRDTAGSVAKQIETKISDLDISDRKANGKFVRAVGISTDADTGEQKLVITKDEIVDADIPDTIARKTYVDSKISTVYKIKGCVADQAALEAITGQQNGDVYNVQAAFTLDEKAYPAGTNVVWVAEHADNGVTHAAHWDALGGTIDLSGYKEKQDAVAVQNLNAARTITGLTQDVNGKIEAATAAIAIAESQVTNLTSDLQSIRSANSANSQAVAKKLDKTATVNGQSFAEVKDGDTVTGYNATVGVKDIKMTDYDGKGTGNIVANEDTVASAFAKIANKLTNVAANASQALGLSQTNATDITTLDGSVLKKDASNVLANETTINAQAANFGIVTKKGIIGFGDNGLQITDDRVTFSGAGIENDVVITNNDAGLILSSAADHSRVIIDGIETPADDPDSISANIYMAANVEYVGSSISAAKSDLIGDTTTENTIKHAEDVAAKALAKANEATSKAGVTSFGGSTGAIDIETESTSNGNVNFSVLVEDGTNKLTGTVYGLKSAAYTESTAYDKAGAAAAVLGTSADTSGTATVYGALASIAATHGTSSDEAGKSTVYGALNQANAALDAAKAAQTTADGAVKLGKTNTATASTQFVGTVGVVVRKETGADITQVNPGQIAIGDTSADSTIINQGSVILKDHVGTINCIAANAGGFIVASAGKSAVVSGIATPTDDTQAANKKYVDDTVSAAALVWNEI